MLQERWIKIHNHPGLSRLEQWDETRGKWIDPRLNLSSRVKVFRAYRRVMVLGRSKLQKRHFRSLEEAKAWRQEVNPYVESHSKRRLTLGAVIQDWRNWTKPPQTRLTTWQQYAKDMVHMNYLSDAPIESISARDIDTWLAHLKSATYPRKVTRVSFCREVGTLQTVFKWYREYRNERFQHPILSRHKRDAVFREAPPKGLVYLSTDQAEEFLDRLGTHLPVYSRIAHLQLFSGVRIGEACGLLWDCVDFEAGTIRISRSCIWPRPSMKPEMQETTKTGKTRFVPMASRLSEKLREWKDSDADVPYVVHKRGELIRRNTVASALGKVTRKMGIKVEGATHVLRRTFATIHAEQTGDLMATQMLLGHTDIRTTQIYAKVTERAARKSMENFTFGQKKEASK